MVLPVAKAFSNENIESLVHVDASPDLRDTHKGLEHHQSGFR